MNTYSEILPHIELQPYIDSYWMSDISGNAPVKSKILPDGCIDIIFNINEDLRTDTGHVLMKSESIYLVGTMTQVHEFDSIGNIKLLGVRFKPAGYSYFFDHSSLHEFRDERIELKKMPLPEIHGIDENTFTCLNRFFLNKLTKPKHSIIPIVNDIKKLEGQLKVTELTKRHYITVRQLERHFQHYVGVSPKEFISLVRYRSTYKKLINNRSQKCLAEIAFESGYADHAHLTKEIKRFTGSTPSQL